MHACTLSLAELENHLQISEKAVAEFIIDMAKDKKTVDEFKKVRGRGSSREETGAAASTCWVLTLHAHLP
jgi:hypothetical protein